jgi:hypothetical protein
MSKKCIKIKHSSSGRARYVARKNGERYGVPYTPIFSARSAVNGIRGENTRTQWTT